MESIKTNLNAAKIQGLEQGIAPNKKPSISNQGPSFEEVLKQNLPNPLQDGLNTAQTQSLKFSNHAIERIKSRGIQMGPEQLQKLEQAVEKAESKGAKETLVLMGSSALIVNIKNKTVVTALDQNMMKENVFTNIDSTVIL